MDETLDLLVYPASNDDVFDQVCFADARHLVSYFEYVLAIYHSDHVSSQSSTRPRQHVPMVKQGFTLQAIITIRCPVS